MSDADSTSRNIICTSLLLLSSIPNTYGEAMDMRKTRGTSIRQMRRIPKNPVESVSDASSLLWMSMVEYLEQAEPRESVRIMT